jgi:hypothetical protein
MARVRRSLISGLLLLSLACAAACGSSSSSSSSSNTATSTTLSSLTLSKTTVNGGDTVTATLSLTGPAPAGGVTFTVASPDFSLVFNNTTLYEVRPGKSSFSFQFQSLPVGSTHTALVIATSLDGQTETASLIIKTANPLQLTGFSLGTPMVTSGGTVGATITLNAPAYSPGQEVVVVSSDAAVVPVNPVVVSTGKTSVTFSIFTQPINTQRTAMLTASLNNVTMSAPLTLTPAGVSITALNFTPPTVAGGQNAVGVATITPPAPAGGVTISLTVSFANPATPPGTPIPFTVPATVMVPAGATEVQFPASSTKVTTTTDLTVTATLGTTGAAFNLEVVPSLRLTAISCTPGTLTGGASGMSGNSGTCSVSLSTPAPAQGQPVQLSSSDSNTLPVPSMVTVPQGQAAFAFTVTAGSPSAITTVTLTATISGSNTGPVTTTVMVVPASALTVIGLILNPASVLGGAGAAGNSTGTLTISGPAPPGGTTIALMSSDPSAQVPASVTVPQNSTSTAFAITTLPVTMQVNAVITAMVNTSTQTATLAVVPVPVLTGVSLSATTVAGGATATATVILATSAPAGPGCPLVNGQPGPSGVCVTLMSSSNLVQIAPNVTVPAGSKTANFLVTTLPVTTQQTANITATLGGMSQQVTLTLTPTPPDIRLLVFNPPTVVAGSSSTGIVVITIPAPATGTVVMLSSANSIVTVPASVTVMAGQTSATFTATTSTVSSTTAVVVTATVTAKAAATLTLIPAPTGTVSEQIIAAGETNSTDFPTQACPTSANGSATMEFCGPLASGEDTGFLTSINQSTPAGSAATSSLSFSTLLGLSTFGQTRDVFVDSSGNVFACGVTSDQHLPTTSNAVQASYGGGNTDAFIVEFNSSGALQYLSYLGGSGDETCFNLTVDSSGNVFLSGSTTNSTAMNAANLTGTTGAFQTANAGGKDFFVAKVNPTTTNAAARLVWLTLVGGAADDFADGRIVVSSTGSIFLTGTSMSSAVNGGFPTPTRPNLAGVGTFGVVVQLSSDGASLLSSTFLFGRVNGANPGTATTTTASGGLAFDVTGNLYVCGQTNASDLLSASAGTVTTPAYQSTLKGQQDAYVARLAGTTGVITAMTYLGGTGSVQACRGLAVDSEHSPVVVLPTDAQDFPAAIRATPTGSVAVTGPVELDGPSDFAITKLTSDLSFAIFSTLVGGSGSETGAVWAPNMPGDTTRVTLDSAENLYFSLATTSTDFPITSNALFSTPPAAGGQKVAIVKLSSDGTTVLYGTYLGGSAHNSTGALAYRHN